MSGVKDYLQFYDGRRVLVTGGAGSIGGRLSHALLAAGARVTVLDDLSSAARWNLPDHARLRFAQGSVLDDAALGGSFADQPRTVFHLAALFANQNSVEHPETDLMVNGMGTLRLLEKAAVSGVERVVFASSGCAFTDPDAPMPLREDYVSLHPSTPYQVTKLLGELYCNYFSDGGRVDCVRMRFFNSFGPGELPGLYRNVIPNFIYLALQGRVLPITGSGDETRDYTFVEDIVDGLLRAGYAEQARGQAFNLAAGREVPILDLAQMINRKTDNQAGVDFLERRAWDLEARRVASIDKARSVLGFAPRVGLEEGLDETIEWFRVNWERITAGAGDRPGQ